MRVCYVHIGNHKTGTTSIQRFLSLNRERFAAAGVFFPQAGSDSGPDYVSHHQVAYELLGSPRFKPDCGGIDALSAELRQTDASVACVSSENFSLLWQHRSALVRLRDAVLAAGFTPKIVCYLRPQASYCTSVYAQVVCNGGYRAPFSTFLASILTNGRDVWGAGIGTPLDYDRLLDPFCDVFGSQALLVRRYRPVARDRALLAEFGRFLVAANDISDFRVPQRRQNGSFDFGTVLEFLQAMPATHERIRFAPLSIVTLFRFAARFGASNDTLDQRYGVRILAFDFIDFALALPLRRTPARSRALHVARRALNEIMTASRPTVALQPHNEAQFEPS